MASRALAAMVALTALSLAACKADNASGYQVRVLIMLSDDLEATTTVNVLEDGADPESGIKDATVTVQLNGGAATPVPYVGSYGYLLWGDISGAPPKAGDAVTASITVGTKNFSQTVTVPGIPKIATPTAAQDASKEIVITWDGVTSPPDEIQVSIADKYTAADNPIGYFKNIPGTSTSYSIPAGTLKAGTKDVYFQVGGENARDLTGDGLEPYSQFTISASAGVHFDTL